VILSAPYAMTHRRLPEGRLLAWIIGIGVFTVIQQSAKTAAYRHAEASFLAPHTYTSMLWATLVGWLLWQEMVTVPVMLGTGMVVSSDLFILRRAGTSDPGSVSHAPKSPC
jgi:drug/metabolite transporter (DMT)-like permease